MKAKFIANEEYLMDFLRETETFKRANLRVKIFTTLFAGIILSLCAFLPMYIIGHQHTIQIYLAIVVGIIFFFVGLYVGFRSSDGTLEITLRKKILKDYPPPISIETEFEITKDNLVFKMREVKEAIPWEKFNEIIVGDNSIYYNFIEPESVRAIETEEVKASILYIPLPFIAFQSAQEKAEFIELSKKFLSEKSVKL